jgi:hypothetical protein
MRFSDLWKSALLIFACALVVRAAEPQDPVAPKKPAVPALRVIPSLRLAPATPNVSAKPAPDSEKPEAKDPRAQATHQQTAIIKVVDDQGSTLPLHTFCLDQTGRILAGVGQKEGELRVFDPEGKFLAAWKIPVQPEAVNVGSDGLVYVAGGGQLLKLDGEGKLLLQKESPHAAAIKANSSKLREDVIAQAKQQTEAFAQAIKSYEQQIERVKKQIEKLSAKSDEKPQDPEQPIDAEKKDDAEQKAESEKRDALKQQQLASQKRTLEALEKQVEAFQQYVKQLPAEMTEEQIQKQVEATLQSKLRMASIAVAGQDVFVTCAALVGYGYEVWRTDAQFEAGEKIIGDLRGCCGQMDVQASTDGVFVAENARYRVRRLDRDGKQLNEWGKSEREGIEGFSSCCNPMNVTFGPGGDVYTSESNTGRIKRFSPAGEFLGCVGQVELVPGCKKVSIAVNQDGSRVYMLDITRTHIVLMTKKPAAPPEATAKAAD